MSGPLSPGDLIAKRYQVKKYIGEGGMQIVYEALDKVTQRRVALKTPKNRSATKRFRRSAIVAARVNHPNVAKTLDYVREDNNRYLIEELIEGQDLGEALLTQSDFLDPHLVAKIFHHLAKGVAAAHHAGVVHRDLKPTNVMVRGGYSLLELKVTDFGIAKLASEEIDEAAAGGSATLSMSQTAVGALPYMAPEAIDTPGKVGPAADIWSIGAMIFHLLAGSPPFGIGLKAVRGILAAEVPAFPPFMSANKQFAPLANDVGALAISCLRREPAARPTADDLVRKCGELCYNPALRDVGVVKRIDYAKYGFINSADRNVFFHSSCVYGPTGLKLGDSVVYSAFDGGGAPRAYPVLKLK